MNRCIYHFLRACLIASALLIVSVPSVRAQQRPYIGFVYPAGGKQGTTFQVRLGGQGVDDVYRVIISGAGVSGRLIECHRLLNNEEVRLLQDQLKELKKDQPVKAVTAAETSSQQTNLTPLISAIDTRLAEHVARPACRSIATLVFAEIAMDSDAAPGDREIRLVTARGVSNPLKFCVGQVEEFTRKPMVTAQMQVLGKEAQALRKRPPEEVEERVTLPCTLNGQIASGEVNRYRFAARKGQRLVISTMARQLIPYIADAVPGWFQPVLVLYDPDGKEVAYDDHYQFKPDPVTFFEVRKTGDYLLEIHDSLYRGREDFIYRITIGEIPFITSIFPLGARVDEPVKIKAKGWHIEKNDLRCPSKGTHPGIYQLSGQRNGVTSNSVPFALDTLPECMEKESNDDQSRAQKVVLPIIVNGRIDRSGDRDLFQFSGKSGDAIVAEVYARRLDSPLDSVLRLIDCNGSVLASNDDYDDPGSGLNTHHADSFLMARLPADGIYFVQIADTAGKGGEDYGYRLRISAPQPGFALRVVPSSAGMRSKGSANLTVFAMRRDGFADPIKISLKNPPPGFSAPVARLSSKDEKVNLSLRTSLTSTPEPVDLIVEGRAKSGDQEIVSEAVAAEDRMQAFLWRHLVPAENLKVLVFDPNYQPQPRRSLPPRPAYMKTPLAPKTAPAPGTTAVPASATNIAPKPAAEQPAGKPRFTEKQVAARLKQLKLLYEEGLLTEKFYWDRVAECESQ